MFFDLMNKINSFIDFIKYRNLHILKSSMKRYIGLDKIKDNILFLKNKSKLAILQIEPINYSIKTQNEKFAVDEGFKKFLNCLDFPIQILITSSKCEFKELFQWGYGNKSLEKFKEYIQKTLEGVRNRNFYLIIPEKTDLEIQTKVCIEKLQEIGLKVRRLNDAQILGILKDFFGNTERKLSQDFIKLDPLYYTTNPISIRNEANHLIVDKRFYRVISANGYPRNVEFGFLDKVINSQGEFDISIHIEPYPIETMMVMLNKELQKQRADLYAMELKGSVNPSLEIQHSDTRRVLDDLQKGEDKLFNISLYINCKADSINELNLLSKKVESELNALLIIPKISLFRQVQAYKGIMPFVKNELGIKRNIPTKALSAFFPFTSPFLNFENKGVFLGLNKNRLPIIRDLFKLANANGIVLATSGSGKSYFAKLLISRLVSQDVKVLVIDPQGEYTALTRACGGEVVTISRNSDTMINPLDLMGHSYDGKLLSLQDLFHVMFSDLSESQKAILDRCLRETYARKGITRREYKGLEAPILEDLLHILKMGCKTAYIIEKPSYIALINRLSMYVEGVFSFLNKKTYFDFSKNFVCFNIGDMPKQVKPVIMFLILDYIYLQMKKDLDRKILVIDEAWSLLSRASEASYIFEIVKTCRKHNLGLLLITQEVADLVNSKAGQSVLANSSYTILLRQIASVIHDVVKTFNLSEREMAHLLTANIGTGLLLMENEHQELEIVASKEEHQLITTNPDELKEIREAQQQENKITRNVDINLDINKGLCLAKILTEEEKIYLKNKGFIEMKFVPLGQTSPQSYLIKPNDRESPIHTFLVKAIADELVKYGKTIKISLTSNPDIIFAYNNNKYAIEVETGSNLKCNDKRLAKKAEQLNKEFGNNWFFVVYLSMYIYFYKKYGKVITRQHLPAFLQQLLNPV